MSDIQVIEVKSSSHKKEFIQLPVGLYKGEKHWIRPFDHDIEEVFDPEKNKYFKHGVCTRWILQKDGKTVGRIAAFINEKNRKETNSKGESLEVGGLGFFECIDDQSIANTLFDTGTTWLKEKGINAVDGPINFGDRDNWWGALTETGRDIDPNYKMPYTKLYYLKLFENYGFQVYFKQVTFGRKVNAPMHPTYLKVAERIFADEKYSFSIIDPKNMDKFAQDFCTIYNKAWGAHAGAAELTFEQAKSRMDQLKQILDPKIVYFAYYDNEPIAFYVNIPEVNQIVKHITNGKLNLMGKLKFLWHMKIAKSNHKMMGMAFGVVPEFQRKGVMLAIVEFCRRFVQEKIRGRYIDFEMNWIGDFNKPMMKISAGIGDPVKVHHTYRKILTPEIEFEPCKEISL